MQGIVDVEEHSGGAVSNYVAISNIVKHMQDRVDAMRACHSYYISHAYTQARSIPRRATVTLPTADILYCILGSGLTVNPTTFPMHTPRRTAPLAEPWCIFLQCMASAVLWAFGFPPAIPPGCAGVSLPVWGTGKRVASCTCMISGMTVALYG